VNIYVVLSHRLEPDELAVMKAWTKRELAEVAAERIRKMTGCLQTAIEVRCISCS